MYQPILSRLSIVDKTFLLAAYVARAVFALIAVGEQPAVLAVAVDRDGIDSDDVIELTGEDAHYLYGFIQGSATRVARDA